MKLLWLTDDFLPHYGGSRILYDHTIRHFAPGEVTVLTKRRPGSLEFDAAAPFEIRRGFFKKLPGPALFADLPLLAEMAARGAYLAACERPDVIVCGEVLPTGLVGRVLAAVFRTPYLVYIHGEEMNVMKNLRGEGRLGFSVLRAAAAVLPSATTARDEALRQGVRPERLHLLTIAVDDYYLDREPDPGRARVRYGLEGKRVVLTVGRLVERKGHDAVIRALAALRPEFPDLVYLIAGAGPFEERLRRAAAEAGVADAVVFTGRIPLEELAECYAACDVFCMPNRELPDGDTEGGGIVFLEAAALGKPAIGGSSGGISDTVGEGVTGFLVDPDAPGELEDRLGRLFREPALARRMGEAARMMVRTGRRWEDRARELRRICEGLIRRRGGRSTGEGPAAHGRA